ncbi:serine carboxypeptidase [Daedalea quercina L-15889]|uniref:Carboxypeptidase n=1 Tax=Daedalea quercina L-15889 TaxID=1314783 RepID=A0A165NL48_9APHY|nr:serine carboxypeptidase [Daedalea quercina L-15889]
MVSCRPLCVFTFYASLAVAVQRPFAARRAHIRANIVPSSDPLPALADATNAHDAALFTPFEDLESLSDAEFTTLRHFAFPKHSVRIKKSHFCDGSVGAYTGYIDIQARHLFFYFFESRDNPDKDDVIFWTNGGPGCSSSTGLFMELGPCRVTNPENATFNPYSWNEKANIFFIDQPIGVGFSYAEFGETVGNTPDAAKDIAAFVAIFFEHFSKFKGRGFHMAGESYGGRYIPLFASEIYDQNARLEAAGMTPINLKSVMIGNGCTDWSGMTVSYFDMQCRPMSQPPIMDIKSCVRMKQAIPRCQQMVKKSCLDRFDSMDCEATNNFCNEELYDPFFATGYNPYDISKLCDGDIEDTLCYPVTQAIGQYLDRPDIRALLGVDPAVSANFSSCDDRVGDAFELSDDYLSPTELYLSALLERGVRVLNYAGANDWMCNWVGNDRMTLALEWSGKDEFRSQPFSQWEVDGEVAGLMRTAGPLTFATIDGAGHMVPYDKPLQSLELTKRWLAGKHP